MKKYLLLIIFLIIADFTIAQENKQLKKQNTEMNVKRPSLSDRSQSPSLSSYTDHSDFSPTPNNQQSSVDSLNFIHKIWDDRDRMNMNLYKYPMPVSILNMPHKYDYATSGTIANYGNFSIHGSSDHQEYTNLMTMQSASLGTSQIWGNFIILANVSANRYFTNHITTQYGIGGKIGYQFNSNLSATLFGQYYGRNPYFNMATYPFVKTTGYGGFFSIESRTLGLDLGVQRYYDTFQHQWITSPIVTPKIHFSKKFTMDLPVGDLIKSSAEKIIFRKQSRGPIIMPPSMR